MVVTYVIYNILFKKIFVFIFETKFNYCTYVLTIRPGFARVQFDDKKWVRLASKYYSTIFNAQFAPYVSHLARIFFSYGMFYLCVATDTANV